MLLDARTTPEGTRLRAKVCIVGAGPTGIAVALSLAASRCDVLVVETGGFAADKRTEALSAGDVVPGSQHPPLNMYRRRVIGGTSYVWGGRCTPFDPIDFRYRPWMPYSGWPVAHEQMVPWYEKANDFLDAGRFSYIAGAALPGRREFMDGFASALLHTDRIERFSRPTNIGRKFKRQIVKSEWLKLLHHAVCTKIRLHADAGRVEFLELKSTHGNSFHVSAEIFVIAGGTLESLRLMLASNDVMPDGVGNHSGWLGRSYLSHLEGNVGELRLKPKSRGLIWGYEKSTDGIYVRRRFAVSESAQETFGVGNGIARLNHPSFADPDHANGILSAAYLAKNLLVPEYRRRITWADRRTASRMAELGTVGLYGRHVVNVLRDLPRVAAFLPWWMWVRTLRSRLMPSLALPSKAGRYPLDFNLEQAPNPTSRVLLGDDLDRFGVPRIRVDWRISDTDVHTIKGTLALFKKAMAESGCAEFVVDPQEAVEQFAPVGGHQMGGARMTSDPRNGVVDADCRVHGVANLYLAGSQVFPTVSYANPTLTAVALAFRLGSHLRARLGPCEAT